METAKFKVKTAISLNNNAKNHRERGRQNKQGVGMGGFFIYDKHFV
jgi:hypothetical protein